MAIFNNPYDELNESKRKTNIEALLQSAALALKADQQNSESQYYKNVGAYYGAAAKQQDLINQIAEQARADQFFRQPSFQPQFPTALQQPTNFPVLPPDQFAEQIAKSGGHGIPSTYMGNLDDAQQAFGQWQMKGQKIDPIKRTIDQDWTNLNTESMLQTVKNLSVEKMTSGERDSFANALNSITGLDNILQQVTDNMDYFKKKLGPTNAKNWRNPISEFMRQVSKDDVALSNLFTDVEGVKQTVRKEITGAGASAAELNMLNPITPSMTDPAPLFLAKTYAYRNTALRIMKNRVAVLSATNIDSEGLKPIVENLAKTSSEEYFNSLTEAGLNQKEARMLANNYFKDAQKNIGGVVSSLVASRNRLGNVTLEQLLEEKKRRQKK